MLLRASSPRLERKACVKSCCWLVCPSGSARCSEAKSRDCHWPLALTCLSSLSSPPLPSPALPSSCAETQRSTERYRGVIGVEPHGNPARCFGASCSLPRIPIYTSCSIHRNAASDSRCASCDFRSEESYRSRCSNNSRLPCRSRTQNLPVNRTDREVQLDPIRRSRMLVEITL